MRLENSSRAEGEQSFITSNHMQHPGEVKVDMGETSAGETFFKVASAGEAGSCSLAKPFAGMKDQRAHRGARSPASSAILLWDGTWTAPPGSSDEKDMSSYQFVN